MLILKFGEKELKVKFGYEATLKTKLLSKVSKKGASIKGEDDLSSVERIEEMMLFLPEMLLVGLQKLHKEEYWFDYETGDGKDEQLEKMYELIEEYCDSENEDEDAFTLFQHIENELMSDGFLASMFRKEQAKTEKKYAE